MDNGTPRWVVCHLRMAQGSVDYVEVVHPAAPPALSATAAAAVQDAAGGEWLGGGWSTLLENALLAVARSTAEDWSEALAEVASLYRWAARNTQASDRLRLNSLVDEVQPSLFDLPADAEV
jgi:hypothetical protein